MTVYIMNKDGHYFTQRGNQPGFTDNIELAYCYNDQEVDVQGVIDKIQVVLGEVCTVSTRFKAGALR